MISSENLQSLLTLLALVGIAFQIFIYFKKPQDRLDKRQAVNDKETSEKAVALAHQVQWTIESNERRFSDLQGNVKEAFALAQNHTHTVEESVKALTAVVNQMNVSLTKELAILSTIIDKKL